MTTDTNKPSPLDITDITDPISNMKSSMLPSFYKDVWDHFSVSTWNSGNDHGMYINMHLQQYFRSGLIMPPLEKSVLQQDIQPDIEKVSLTLRDGSQTVALKDDLHEGGPRRVQCMMMAHKGRSCLKPIRA